MPNWNGLIITKKGRDLQAKVEAGKTALNLTKMKIGSGTLPTGQQLENLTDLVEPKQNIGIALKEAMEDGLCRISATITNSELNTGYYVKELGVFAQDPDNGEILYAITADTAPDYLPAKGGATVVSQEFAVYIAISNASKITAKVDPTALATMGYVKTSIAQAFDQRKPIEYKSGLNSVKSIAGSFWTDNLGVTQECLAELPLTTEIVSDFVFIQFGSSDGTEKQQFLYNGAWIYHRWSDDVLGSEIWNKDSWKLLFNNNIVPITAGGTGADNAAQALKNLGITASASELNFVKGVTSSVQTQLNGKASSGHKHSAGDITSGTLPIARGGTGATSAAQALKNLGGLAASGDTLNGTIKSTTNVPLCGASEQTGLQIQGGLESNKSGQLILWGNEHPEYAGMAMLQACLADGTKKSLTLAPSGGISWDSKTVVVVEEQQLGVNSGYVKYSNGFQIVWGHQKTLPNDDTVVTFAVPFAAVPIVLPAYVSIETGTTFKGIWQRGGATLTNFNVYTDHNVEGAISYIAIGRWK